MKKNHYGSELSKYVILTQAAGNGFFIFLLAELFAKIIASFVIIFLSLKNYFAKQIHTEQEISLGSMFAATSSNFFDKIGNRIKAFTNRFSKRFWKFAGIFVATVTLQILSIYLMCKYFTSENTLYMVEAIIIFGIGDLIITILLLRIFKVLNNAMEFTRWAFYPLFTIDFFFMAYNWLTICIIFTVLLTTITWIVLYKKYSR